jgi:hypothetical protein
MWSNTCLNCWYKIFSPSNLRYIHWMTLTSQLIKDDLEWSLSRVMCMFQLWLISDEMWISYMKKCWYWIFYMLWVTLNIPKWPWEFLVNKSLSKGIFDNLLSTTSTSDRRFRKIWMDCSTINKQQPYHMVHGLLHILNIYISNCFLYDKHSESPVCWFLDLTFGKNVNFYCDIMKNSCKKYNYLTWVIYWHIPDCICHWFRFTSFQHVSYQWYKWTSRYL